MKTLLALVSSFILATSAFAVDQTVELKSEKVLLGALAQDRGASAKASINVVRTEATPDVVELVFNFKEGAYVCTQYVNRTIFEPGYYRTVCSENRHGHVVCRRIYVGGYYRTVSECVRHDYRLFDTSRSLKLNFKKAESLRVGEKETFSIEFNQRSIGSNKFNYTARSVETIGDYKLKYSTFLRKDTFFVKKK